MVGSGWEWVGVTGSGWEWMGVGGSGWEWVGARFSITHFNLVHKKVVQKLHAFDRVVKLISKKKLRVIMKAFMSLFCYCLLVWMYHSRTLNNKIYKLHKRTLQLVYYDRQSTFEELFSKDGRIDSSVVRHVLIVTDVIVKKKFDKGKEVVDHLSKLIVPRLKAKIHDLILHI